MIAAIEPSLKCRHCPRVMKRRKFRKGLCWKCSADPEISELYETESKWGTRPLFGTDFLGAAPKPTNTTESDQGTEERILTYQRRVQLLQDLFVTEDGQKADIEQLWKLSLRSRFHIIKTRKRLTYEKICEISGLERKSIFRYLCTGKGNVDTENRIALALGITRIILIGGKDPRY